MHSNPKSRLLIESVSIALLAARDQHGWSILMPAVNVSYTGDNYVMVHLLPVGVFGPYSRSQIPHAVISDFAKVIGSGGPKAPTATVQRRQLSRKAVPAPLSIAQLISDAALSAESTSRSDEDKSSEHGSLKC